MTFGNGPQKGNGQRPRGKSIREHMADAIALGASQEQCVDYVRNHVSTSRLSRRRLREIHKDMLPNKEGQHRE